MGPYIFILIKLNLKLSINKRGLFIILINNKTPNMEKKKNPYFCYGLLEYVVY